MTMIEAAAAPAASGSGGGGGGGGGGGPAPASLAPATKNEGGRTSSSSRKPPGSPPNPVRRYILAAVLGAAVRLGQHSAPGASWACSLSGGRRWCAEPKVEVAQMRGRERTWERSLEAFASLLREGRDTESQFSVALLGQGDKDEPVATLELNGGPRSGNLPLLSLAQVVGTIALLREMNSTKGQMKNERARDERGSSSSSLLDDSLLPGSQSRLGTLLRGDSPFPFRFSEQLPSHLFSTFSLERSSWLSGQLRAAEMRNELGACAWGRGVSSALFMEEAMKQPLILAASQIFDEGHIDCSASPFPLLKGPPLLHWVLLHRPKLLLEPGRLSRLLVPDALLHAIPSYARDFLVALEEGGGQEGHPLSQATAATLDWAEFGNSISMEPGGARMLEGCRVSAASLAQAVVSALDLGDLWDWGWDEADRAAGSRKEENSSSTGRCGMRDFARTKAGLINMSQVMRRRGRGEIQPERRQEIQDALSACTGWIDPGGSGTGFCEWGEGRSIVFAYMSDRIGLFESDRLRSLLLAVAKDVGLLTAKEY